MKKTYKIMLIISTILFICFFLSMLLVLTADYLSAPKIKGNDELNKESLLLIQAIGSLITMISVISSIILSWRKDRREVNELRLKIMELEMKKNSN